MWPSLETANAVGDWANRALIGSLVVGVVSTVLIVWMGSAKETYWDLDRQQSRERVAALDVAVAQANERAALANEKAESERLARLRLEAQLAPRRLTGLQTDLLTTALSAMKERIPKLVVTRLGDREAHDFANDILACADKAGMPMALRDIGMMTPPLYGVQIVDTPDGVIAAAFASANVKATAIANINGDAGQIFVGLKIPALARDLKRCRSRRMRLRRWRLLHNAA